MATKAELVPGSDSTVRILRVEGEIDMESSPVVKDQIIKALNGAKALKIDLKSVTYLDSSGIAILIEGLKRAQKAKVDYCLLDTSPQVRAVIKLAMLESIFKFESRDGK